MDLLGKSWRCYDADKTKAHYLKKYLKTCKIEFETKEKETSVQIDIFVDAIQELMVNSFLAGYDNAESEFAAIPLF